MEIGQRSSCGPLGQILGHPAAGSRVIGNASSGCCRNILQDTSFRVALGMLNAQSFISSACNSHIVNAAHHSAYRQVLLKQELQIANIKEK